MSTGLQGQKIMYTTLFIGKVCRKNPGFDKDETCVISCMKRVASPGSMHDAGCLGLVHWDDPEGGCGKGGGRGVQDGEQVLPVVDS